MIPLSHLSKKIGFWAPKLRVRSKRCCQFLVGAFLCSIINPILKGLDDDGGDVHDDGIKGVPTFCLAVATLLHLESLLSHNTTQLVSALVFRTLMVHLVLRIAFWCKAYMMTGLVLVYLIDAI